MNGAYSKALKWFLIAGFALSMFYRLGYMPLSADEPIRALIALDMEVNGHYLAPEDNGDPYLNKPPLYNWLLVLLFKITGSHSEWMIRLPSILSLFIFMYVVYRVVKRVFENEDLAFISAMALGTSGNILIYSSYLGHIDITYSLITFVQMIAILKFSKHDEDWKGWVISYFLALAGFMMKGLPSIVFQGITLFTVYLYRKKFRKLFHWQHWLSMLMFIVPVGIYLYLFKDQGDAVDLIRKLVLESTSRTVTDKSFLESISHLFAFPFLFLIDVMPWGLLVVLLFIPSVRKKLFASDKARQWMLIFAANIVVYWLSPDYRARYVFMLIPFFIVPLLWAGWEIISTPKIRPSLWVAAIGLTSLTVLISISKHYEDSGGWIPGFLIVLFFTALVSALFYYHKLPPMPAMLVLVLILIRITYSQYSLPMRVHTGVYEKEKNEALRFAAICKDEPTFMYHSNVSQTMNWYFSSARMKMLTTKRSGFVMDAYYFVPSDVLTDRENVVVFDTFVRRYGSKPFELVKFKNYFPPMPKEK
ncbi:MAG: hypothetical protein GC181_05930 [Bacteroidetes bacterium]|nr:hypothetical protein [Bacteroidota bacterium]